MADYEVWLTDDAGTRLLPLLDKTEVFFFSYTRVVSGLGTVNFGLSFREFSEKVKPYFRPDWRVDIWRSPAPGFKMRREDVFMLRKPHIYTRDDGVEVIQFYGRNGIDLLKRRAVIQRAGTEYAKRTQAIDDMMKGYVRQAMFYGSARDENGVVDNTRAWPEGEFNVQANSTLGPVVTRDFADRNIFEVLRDLKDLSIQKNADSSTNRRVYFDVVPKDFTTSVTQTNSPLGWEFQTFMDQRGSDRTTGVVFSLDNENIEKPSYSISHLDEVNHVFIRGNGQGASQIVTSVEDSPREVVSRWNRVETVISASSETTTAALQDVGRSELTKGKPVEEALVTLLNSPGGENVPRSLYGLDWDLGDLVPVEYADREMNMEIGIVYVSVDENGKEVITGRTVSR